MTLVEVLVTIVIGTISAAAIFYSYNIFNKSYQSVADKAVMNTSARNALSVILKDLRNAGYCDLNFKDSKDCDLIIQKKDNHYDIEVAVAGFNKKDIKVSYADGQLSIESVKNDKAKEKDENGIIHRGIAKR